MRTDHCAKIEIGLVLQKNHIFKGSIYDNILYGNTGATCEEVVAAALPVRSCMSRWNSCREVTMPMPSS